MNSTRLAPLLAAAAMLFAASERAAAESPNVAPVTMNLSFGQIVVGKLPGSVRVSASGMRSTSGAAYEGNRLGVSAASFAVATPPNDKGSGSWSVMLPVSATLSSGKNEMTIDGFEYSWGPASGPVGRSSRMLTVGGTLHVGAGQAPAQYSGTFALTLAYN
jgi:hypothetical protein